MGVQQQQQFSELRSSIQNHQSTVGVARHHRRDRTALGTHNKIEWRHISRPHNRHRHSALRPRDNKPPKTHHPSSAHAQARFCVGTVMRDHTPFHTPHDRKKPCHIAPRVPDTRIKSQGRFVKKQEDIKKTALIVRNKQKRNYLCRRISRKSYAHCVCGEI